MAFSDVPTVRVEIGFGVDPSVPYLFLDDAARGLLGTGVLGPDGGVWTDVSTDLRAWSVDRGKNNGLDAFRDGAATVVLDNRSGDYDPSNTSSPYYVGGVTQVEPMRRIRITATWAAVDYPLFDGFVAEWILDYRQGRQGGDATVTLPCMDAFAVLANFDGTEQTAAGAGETTGARVVRILDNADWPDGDRDIDTGLSTVQATTLAQNALTELKLTADTEQGWLFVSADGLLTFRDRHALIEDTRSQDIQVTVSDSAGSSYPYRSVRRDNGADYVRNTISFARTGGTAQTASDATSQAKYLKRSWTRTDLLNEDDDEVSYAADAALMQCKDRRDTFSEVVIAPRRKPATWWPAILATEFGDLWRVSRTPPGMGAITRDAFVIGLSQGSGPDRDWDVRVKLQDAARLYGSENGRFLILDDVDLGKLDTGTLAAY